LSLAPVFIEKLMLPENHHHVVQKGRRACSYSRLEAAMSMKRRGLHFLSLGIWGRVCNSLPTGWSIFPSTVCSQCGRVDTVGWIDKTFFFVSNVNSDKIVVVSIRKQLCKIILHLGNILRVPNKIKQLR